MKPVTPVRGVVQGGEQAAGAGSCASEKNSAQRVRCAARRAARTCKQAEPDVGHERAKRHKHRHRGRGTDVEDGEHQLGVARGAEERGISSRTESKDRVHSGMFPRYKHLRGSAVLPKAVCRIHAPASPAWRSGSASTWLQAGEKWAGASGLEQGLQLGAGAMLKMYRAPSKPQFLTRGAGASGGGATAARRARFAGARWQFPPSVEVPRCGPLQGFPARQSPRAFTGDLVYSRPCRRGRQGKHCRYFCMYRCNSAAAAAPSAACGTMCTCACTALMHAAASRLALDLEAKLCQEALHVCMAPAHKSEHAGGRFQMHAFMRAPGCLNTCMHAASSLWPQVQVAPRNSPACMQGLHNARRLQAPAGRGSCAQYSQTSAGCTPPPPPPQPPSAQLTPLPACDPNLSSSCPSGAAASRQSG